MTDPRYPAVDSETGKVYVTSYSTSTVSVIDEKTNTVVATIPVGSGPQEVAVDPKTQKAYVINFAGGTVSVISTQTNSVIATIPVGKGGANPRGMALDPKTGKVYVANDSTKQFRSSMKIAKARSPPSPIPVIIPSIWSPIASTEQSMW